jgi:PAS domain S-box-containing protein
LLGAILFQILTGHPPHHGSSLLKCIRSAAANEIRPTRIEGELMDIAMKAMSTRPADRYQVVDDLISAINDQQQHDESERLVKRAQAMLQEEPADGHMENYRIADALLREAIEIWPENHRAKDAIVELNIEFARAATANGDLELALHLYETAGQSDSEAAARIRRELDCRKTAGQRVARYSALFTQLPEAGLLGSIATGKVVEANEKFGRLFGYAPEQIVGKRLDELNLWIYEQQRLGFVSRIQENGRVQNFEAQLMHASGEPVDVLISARTTTINDEEMVVSTLRDISDRKETERQLEKNRRRLADMQRLAGLGTWMYDVSAQQVQWSDEAYRLAGRSPHEGVPSRREYLQRIHPEDRRGLLQAIRHAVESVASFEIRVRQRRPHGGFQGLIIRGQPIQDESGNTVEVYGVLIPTQSC